MVSQDKFLKALRQTKILRFPRHSLATFGTSEIRYALVSALSETPPQANLRQGVVVASRPKIITRESLAQRFHGFGDDADEFDGVLRDAYRDARGLEYNFHNKLEGTELHSLDARALADNVQKDFDSSEPSRSALISGPEAGWQFSLMKFIVEETLRSFKSNVMELDERGLFDPAQAAMSAKRAEIESLFALARRDRSQTGQLGKKLKEYGLFEDYQDRFFQLVR